MVACVVSCRAGLPRPVITRASVPLLGRCSSRCRTILVLGGVMPNCVHPPLDVQPSAPAQLPVKPSARQDGRLFVVVERDAFRHSMLKGPRSAFNRLVSTRKTI